MTPRQARFVDEYLVDANATQAAIRAGIAPSGAHVWGSRALRNANVSEALQTRQKADQERLQIDREKVVAMLQEAFVMAREQREPAAMISACRELSKLFGLYEPVRAQVDIGHDESGHLSRLEMMSDRQLLELIQGSAQQAEVFTM